MREFKHLKRIITIGNLGAIHFIKLEYLEKDSEGNYNLVFSEPLKDGFGNIVLFYEETELEKYIERLEKEDEELKNSFRIDLKNFIDYTVEREV